MRRGSKKSPVTKEQLEQQQRNNEKREFIKNKLFPALVSATISVDEATFLLQALVALIMEEAMETLRSKKMDEIKGRIVKKLCPNDERLLQIEHLVGLFDDLTLFDARGHVEGIKAVIEQMKIDEMQSRKLDTLKVNWERYLTK